MNEYEVIANMVINCPSHKLDQLASDVLDAVVTAVEKNNCLVGGGFEFRLLSRDILDS